MGKGSYIGGSTLFNQGDQSWFGQGPDAVEQAAEKKGGITRNQRRRMKIMRDALKNGAESAHPRSLAKPLTVATEARLAKLRACLAGSARQAKEAVALHEAHRQELLNLLREHGLPSDKYPEIRKLDF